MPHSAGSGQALSGAQRSRTGRFAVMLAPREAKAVTRSTGSGQALVTAVQGTASATRPGTHGHASGRVAVPPVRPRASLMVLPCATKAAHPARKNPDYGYSRQRLATHKLTAGRGGEGRAEDGRHVQQTRTRGPRVETERDANSPIPHDPAVLSVPQGQAPHRIQPQPRDAPRAKLHVPPVHGRLPCDAAAAKAAGSAAPLCRPRAGRRMDRAAVHDVRQAQAGRRVLSRLEHRRSHGPLPRVHHRESAGLPGGRPRAGPEPGPPMASGQPRQGPGLRAGAGAGPAARHSADGLLGGPGGRPPAAPAVLPVRRQAAAPPPARPSPGLLEAARRGVAVQPVPRAGTPNGESLSTGAADALDGGNRIHGEIPPLGPDGATVGMTTPATNAVPLSESRREGTSRMGLAVPLCLRASVPPCLRASVPLCLRAFVPLCLRASVPLCLRASVPLCLRASVPAFR